jgi:hypothetical protein
MRKLLNSMLASLFVFAVLAAAPLYTDFIDNPNPGAVDVNSLHTPDVMGSW